MAVRVWLISDLHLEDLDHTGWRPSADPVFDVLACAGDVVESDPGACVDVVARLAGGRPAVMVLGNHDVWNRALGDALAEAMAQHPGVVVLGAGQRVEVGGLAFSGGTLWDDPADWPQGIPRVKATDATQSGEPVFVGTGDGRRHATLRDLAEAHAVTMEGIAASGAAVVLTHYPPSQADVDRLRAPAVWMHGHRHTIRNDASGPHQLVRMPCRRDINLLGAIVEVGPGGPPCRVAPVVGLGRFGG